jgi:predicted ArsR family transcriptional regulator
MNQLSLFAPRKLARTTDPATSKAAAASAEHLRNAHARAIVGVLERSNFPLAAEQIARKLGLSSVQVSRRLHELVDSGFIEPTALLHTNRSGKSAVKYRLKGEPCKSH